MDAVLEALRDLLGLGAEATEEEILAGIAALKDKMAGSSEGEAAVENSRKLLKLVGEELKVATTGEFDAIANSVRTSVKALRDAASSDAATLAIGQLKLANDRIAALEAKQESDEWNAFVVANSKKIKPAEMEAYRKLWDADRDSVISIVNASPELVHTEPGKGGKPANAGGGERMVIINSARAKYREGMSWGDRSERQFLDGELLANRQARLSEQERQTLGIG